MPSTTTAAAALAAAALLATGAAASVVTVSRDGWYSGRATFFGASDELVQTFERIRGPGSYGDLHYGSCGYFNKPQGVDKIRPQDLPFDQAHAAAAADVNPDFPGSCGRCYEIRCKQGVVPKDFTDSSGTMTPFKTQDHFYMPKYDTTLKDGQGRSWPGNPWEAEGLQGAICWSNSTTTWVRIVDSCPPNPNSPWCAASSTVAHFDLSYWAFEQLAHPLYGVMPIEFRPIDCDTKAPLPYLPGTVSKTIYKDGPSPGWSWQTWKPGYQLFDAKQGPDGSNAACASLLPDGGMRWVCRGCEKSGYQPFAGASKVSFNVKADDSVLKFAASPAGSVPPLKVYLIRGAEGSESFCGQIFTANRKPDGQLGGGWFSYSIPLSEFGCAGGDVTGIGFSHAGPNDYIAACVDDIVIGGGASGGAVTGGTWAPPTSAAPSGAPNTNGAGWRAPPAPGGTGGANQGPRAPWFGRPAQQQPQPRRQGPPSA